jgi:hypothetical protein
LQSREALNKVGANSSTPTLERCRPLVLFTMDVSSFIPQV